MIIQYPTNVIFKVSASVSADCFPGEMEEGGKRDLRSSAHSLQINSAERETGVLMNFQELHNERYNEEKKILPW